MDERSSGRIIVFCLTAGLGFNRCALLEGSILNQLGMSGCQAVERLRVRRPGALLNECVASYLQSM